MKEKYIMDINTICKSCGYRNKLVEEYDEPIDIIACGSCGAIINLPKNMSDDNIGIVKQIINSAIKDREAENPL